MFVQKQLFQQSLLIVIVALSFGEYMEPSRYELIQNILRETNYDHSFPPNSESVTHVSVQLSVTDLSSENDIKKDIEFTIYLRMNWTDRRLNFEGSNTSYDVISLGDDIVDDIWLPDLYFHHERKSDLHGFFANNQLVYLHKNGNILYSGRFSIESHCPMEFRKYPFDKQTCPIIIQSYAFPSDILRLNWNGGKNAIKIDNESKNNLKVDQDSVKHTFDPPYPDAVAVFSTLTANLVYERQTASFIIMGPPFFFFVIALLSFLIRDDFSTRITLITGTSVSNFVHWTGIRSTLPSDSSFNYFDILMIVNFIYFGVILTIHIGKRYWKQYKVNRFSCCH
ncbi:gamma-aminobutyric acid receptor subunit rho-1-like [Ruditapes philippinarum]|uniref:gamma-aminobutyric acid receptor subunit rho-1-like n=1 Tax=Ruditapes philippinarum TaxID=129788 RepID=UPI00295A7145|nr:gamma-aminobutyric acid receptor subunit rho-1-like [Ruditapes philippinarum]